MVWLSATAPTFKYVGKPVNPLLTIDLYCERTAPGFWNEPVNALSNLSFLIAAVLAWHIASRRDPRNVLESCVILMAGAIGIGSFLFHTFANSWTELADVIPIWSFVAAYVLLVIYRSSDHNLPKTLRIAAITLAVIGTVFWFTSQDVTTDTVAAPARFNGSLQYAPALIALVAFAIITLLRKHPARLYVVGAALTFFVSLVFRSIDLSTCSATGLGTHFMWHLLNGLMVGLLLQALVRHFPPPQPRV